MKKFAGLALAMSLVANMASAAEIGALAPGKPAGVDQAQTWNVKTLAVVGGGVSLIVGFSLLIKGGTSTPIPIAGGAAASNTVAVTSTTTQ